MASVQMCSCHFRKRIPHQTAQSICGVHHSRLLKRKKPMLCAASRVQTPLDFSSKEGSICSVGRQGGINDVFREQKACCKLLPRQQGTFTVNAAVYSKRFSSIRTVHTHIVQYKPWLSSSIRLLHGPRSDVCSPDLASLGICLLLSIQNELYHGGLLSQQ